MSTDFWFLGFPPCARWIFRRRFGSRCGSRNVVETFTSHTVQKTQKPEIESFDTFSKIYEIFER